MDCGCTATVMCSVCVFPGMLQGGGKDRPTKEMEYAMRAAKRSLKQKRMRACAETDSMRKKSSGSL